MKTTTKNEFKRTEVGTIPEDWEVSELQQVSRVIDSLHVTPRYSPDGISMVRASDIKSGNLDLERTLRVTKEVYEEFTRNHKPRRNDIVMSRVGTYFVTSFVGTDEPFCMGQNTVVICPSINSRFVYYSLNSGFVTRQIEEKLVGSGGQETISLKDIRELRILKPTDEREIEGIARILSGLDSKIELNRLMNKTLEAIGRAIFSRWFIDFEFPNEGGKPYKSSGGEMGYHTELEKDIPVEWEVSRLVGVVKVELGGTPDRTRKEFWNGGINWINSGKVNEFRIVEPSEKITKEGLEKSATKLLPKGTVVLAITGATLGQVSRLEIDSCANQSVIGIVENEKFPSEYIYFWVKETIDDIVRWQTGGAQQHINKANVENSDVLLPSERVMKMYVKIAGPVFEKISLLCLESQNLERIRDSLLPKLMTGKIRVPVEVR